MGLCGAEARHACARCAGRRPRNPSSTRKATQEGCRRRHLLRRRSSVPNGTGSLRCCCRCRRHSAGARRGLKNMGRSCQDCALPLYLMTKTVLAPSRSTAGRFLGDRAVSPAPPFDPPSVPPPPMHPKPARRRAALRVNFANIAAAVTEGARAHQAALLAVHSGDGVAGDPGYWGSNGFRRHGAEAGHENGRTTRAPMATMQRRWQDAARIHLRIGCAIGGRSRGSLCWLSTERVAGGGPQVGCLWGQLSC